MKVFWSWQADTPGESGRHFVRKALDTAIERLKQGNEIAEADRDALHLDHDRKGLSGSPDLAPAILGKIRASQIFIADVTSIGIVDASGASKKKVINSNVAIELGFAAGVIGDDKILMVQNTFYGSREDLPFDLRGKAGPLQFNLAPDADASEKARVSKDLVAILVRALAGYLAVPPASRQAVQKPKHRLSMHPSDFEGATNLAMLDPNGPDMRMVRFNSERAVYLRFVPTATLPRPLTSARMLELAQMQRLALLDPSWAPAQSARNPTGASYFRIPPDEKKRAVAATQLMPTGEMWALSSQFFDPKATFINVTGLREPLVRTLRSFHAVYLNELGGSGSVNIEIGVFGLTGLRCHWSTEKFDGPFYHFSINHEATLSWTDEDPEREAIVDAIVYKIVEEAGVRVATSRRDRNG
ncbi:hypothetical protein [Rhizobium mongolense]